MNFTSQRTTYLFVWFVNLIFLSSTAPSCLALKWPKRHNTNNKRIQTTSRRSSKKERAILSDVQLEPLLQVPCAIQLCKSSDVSDVPKRLAVGAFLDTGAQRTCMSWKACQKMGLAHLLDRRYAGQAAGVGFCRVLGRIPAQTVQLHFHGIDDNGNDDYDDVDEHDGQDTNMVVMAPAITILESTGTDEVELLLGLDFLRDAHAIIDMSGDYVQLSGNSGKNQVVVDVTFIRPRGNMLGTTAAENKRSKKIITLESVETEVEGAPKRPALKRQPSTRKFVDIDYESDEEEFDFEKSNGDEEIPMDFSGI